MGLLTSQVRQAELNSYINDLDYQIQTTNTQKMNLAKEINEIVGLGTDMEPNSPEAKALQSRKDNLYQLEKAIDQKLQRYQNQLQMAEGEQQSLKSQVQQNIQKAYS